MVEKTNLKNQLTNLATKSELESVMGNKIEAH